MIHSSNQSPHHWRLVVNNKLTNVKSRVRTCVNLMRQNNELWLGIGWISDPHELFTMIGQNYIYVNAVLIWIFRIVLYKYEWIISKYNELATIES